MGSESNNVPRRERSIPQSKDSLHNFSRMIFYHAVLLASNNNDWKCERIWQWPICYASAVWDSAPLSVLGLFAPRSLCSKPSKCSSSILSVYIDTKLLAPLVCADSESTSWKVTILKCFAKKYYFNVSALFPIKCLYNPKFSVLTFRFLSENFSQSAPIPQRRRSLGEPWRCMTKTRQPWHFLKGLESL